MLTIDPDKIISYIFKFLVYGAIIFTFYEVLRKPVFGLYLNIKNRIREQVKKWQQKQVKQ